MNSPEPPNTQSRAEVTPENNLYVLAPVTLRVTGGSVLRSLFIIVTHHWMIIVAFILTFLSAGAVYTFSANPIYRAETRLAPINFQSTNYGLGLIGGQFAGLAALTGFPAASTATTQEAVEILQSRAFTARFIEDLNLLPILFYDQYDDESKTWYDPADQPSLTDGVNLFDEEIRKVSTDISTGFVTLSVQWQNPLVASNWANDLVARINSELRNREATDATNSIDYLRRQLAKTDIVEIRNTLFELIEEHEKRRMLAAVNDQFAFRVLDPATPPETDDPIHPKPLLILFTTGILGLIFGFVVATLKSTNRKDVLR